MKLIQHFLHKPFVIKPFMLFLLAVPLLAVGCNKNITDKIDIRAHEWELKSITKGGQTEKIPKKDFHRSKAYTLIFKNDSTFQLDTGHNLAKGFYEIPKNREIKIKKYKNITEVTETNLGLKLMEVLNEVTTYEVFGGLNKTLVFDGPKGKVKFEKK